MKRHGIVITDTGSANLASVAAAFGRLGIAARVCTDAASVREAALAVLPGVGAFGPGAGRLRTLGLDEAIRARVREGRPLLAICLGMQLLCEASEEAPGARGLGVIPGRLRRFAPGVRTPQMGWNDIAPVGVPSLLRAGAMYFANSYRLERMPEGWAGAMSEHGGGFVSAVERGPLLACQFHPELSGTAGLDLIDRWLSRRAVEEVSAC